MPSGDDGGDAQARGRMRFTARMYSVSSPAMRRTARSKLHPFSFSFYLSPSKCSPSEVCALTAKIVSPERGTHGSPPGGSTGAGACTRRDGIGDGRHIGFRHRHKERWSTSIDVSVPDVARNLLMSRCRQNIPFFRLLLKKAVSASQRTHSYYFALHCNNPLGRLPLYPLRGPAVTRRACAACCSPGQPAVLRAADAGLAADALQLYYLCPKLFRKALSW